MRIVASVGVKDEAELIERTIAHLRAIGVDLIIVCDKYSTDGTAELLQSYSSADDLWFFQMSDQETYERFVGTTLEWVNRSEADWVIFLDADEFPIAASGSLKDCAALEQADVVQVDRFNIPLGIDGPLMPADLVPSHYEQLLLVAGFIPDFWNHLEKNPQTSWMRSRVAPRVLARPERIKGLVLGAHDIVPTDQAPLRRSTPSDLLVAHLPFTTPARFARKVANIRSVLTTHDELFGEDAALHWRRWAALPDRGSLDEEFDRMIFDASTIAELREQGAIRSAADLFRERMNANSI
jgi:hypothetical protein